MKRGPISKWFMRTLLATTAIGTPTAAFAQDPPDQDGFGDIVITAQKREENLQDVPISVQALTAERLDELQITSFSDYAQYLPSVSFAASYGPGFNRAYIRGVANGENGNHSGSQPSVGTYLDEQPITTIGGALDLHIYDVARVEVLSGPQGTLYGANSQSGTIRIITNRPNSDAFEAGWDAEVNAIDGGDRGSVLEGFVNIPASERAAIRLVGWAEEQAGFIDNVYGERTYPSSGITDDNADRVKENYNVGHTYGARAALRIDLNDTWTVTPSLMGQYARTAGLFAFDPQVGDLQVTHWMPETNTDQWVQAAATVEGRISNLDIVYTTAYLERTMEGRQDYADYGYFYDVLYGSGTAFYDNLGNLINPAQWVFDEHEYRKTSHELRISSPAENRMRFIGGLFYQRHTDDIYQRYIVHGLDDDLEVSTLEDTVWLTSQIREDVETALFGEVSFDFTDQLTLTGGLRLFETESSLLGFFGFGAGFSTSQGEFTCFSPESHARDAPCTDVDKSFEEEGSTHRLNLEYQFDSDRLIYATWSTGFRPGGVNRRGDLPNYDADFLTNYEIGWKTEWNDSLRWNGAIFLQQWEDFQYTFIAAGSSGLPQIQNAGNADILGVETDFTWLATENLRISGAATWLDSETTEDTEFAPSGTTLPTSPDVKANLVGRYEFGLGNWDAFAQGAVAYQGEATVDLGLALGTLEAFTTLDFSAGVEHEGFRFSAYLNNATDERGIVARYVECAISTCGAQPYDVPIQPRTVGLRIGRSF
jgi:iron complex outermembrane recepter protein